MRQQFDNQWLDLEQKLELQQLCEQEAREQQQQLKGKFAAGQFLSHVRTKQSTNAHLQEIDEAKDQTAQR